MRKKRTARNNHGWTPQRIQALRIARGEETWEFAKELRTHWRVVQRWESGVNVPTGTTTLVLDLMERRLREKEVVRT